MKCEICNREVKDNSQFINGSYYHNSCIEQLTVIYKIEQKIVAHSEVQLEIQLDKWNKLKERVKNYRLEKTGTEEDGRYCVAISVTDILKMMEEIEEE